MGDGKLLGCRHAQHLAHPRDPSPVLGQEFDAELIGVRDYVEHPAVANVHGHFAETGHVHDGVKVHREGGHVAEGDAGDLAAMHLRAHPDEARGSFQQQLRHRFLRGDHARLDENGRNADGVAPGHGRVFGVLHDDVAGIGLGVRRRQDHVAAERGIAPGLAQHAPPQAVAVAGQPLRLFEHRRAGDVHHAADDDPSGLAAGVGVDRGDHLRYAHQFTPFSRAPGCEARSHSGAPAA